MSLEKLLCHIIAERHAYAGNFEGVGEAVVYEDATREGEYLSLVLQPTEGSRKDQSVIVTLELRSVVMTFGMTVLLTESFVGYQLLPIHHNWMQRYENKPQIAQISQKLTKK
jgi:hypothetical protein